MGRKRKPGPRTKSGRLSRAGKRYPELRDQGTFEGQRKRAALINGASVELAASASGILFANGHLEQKHFSAAINYARLHALVFGRQGPTPPCLLGKHLSWQGGPVPDEGGIEAAERKLIRLNGLLTDAQKQQVGNVAVFSNLPTWFYMGKFKRIAWRTFPEDEVERRDLIDGLSILAKAMGLI
jgi:hypothetical protein